MRRVSFDAQAWADYNWWGSQDPKVQKRIFELIEASSRDPFAGIGKPEPLRHQLRGSWSRRIDNENRLAYKVTDDEIFILSCKEHYAKQ